MGFLNFIKNLLTSDFCSCVCHDNGRNIVHKGVYHASCEHCYKEPKSKKGSTKWGTAISH